MDDAKECLTPHGGKRFNVRRRNRSLSPGDGDSGGPGRLLVTLSCEEWVLYTARTVEIPECISGIGRCSGAICARWLAIGTTMVPTASIVWLLFEREIGRGRFPAPRSPVFFSLSVSWCWLCFGYVFWGICCMFVLVQRFVFCFIEASSGCSVVSFWSGVSSNRNHRP